MLIGALKDKHPRVRSSAAHALGRIGNPTAVEPLTVALKDTAPQAVRINVLHALGKFGRSAAAAALTSALADPAASVRRCAITALKKKQVVSGLSPN